MDAAAALGALPRETYLRARQPGLYETWQFANQNLEPTARIVVGPMVNYAHGATYYCDRACYVTDAFLQQRLRMDTWEHFTADLARDRIGYAVVQTPVDYHHDAPDYLPARNEEPFIGRLAADRGTPIFSSGYFTLYRLAPW
jgi:hypothetical protein